MRPNRLAFCITIKNRSFLKVDIEDSTPFLKHAQGNIKPSPYPHNNVQLDGDKLILTLFPKMIRSLVKLKKPEDDWVIVVTDFQSTDADVAQVLKDEVGSAIPYLHHMITDYPFFDRGGGLKKAAELAESHFNADAVFFLDADLEFYSRDIIEKCYFALENHWFFYPIFYAFADPQHQTGFFRDTSYGNFAARLEDYKQTKGWLHNISWGWEDRDLADSIPDAKKYRIIILGFCHQWHPMKWDFRVSEYPVKEYLFKGAAVKELPNFSSP